MKLRMSAFMHAPKLKVSNPIFLLFGLYSSNVKFQIRSLNKMQNFLFF